MNIYLFRTKNPILANKVCEYLIKSLPMARDGNAIVIQDDRKYAASDDLAVIIPDDGEYWCRYTNTIQQIQNAATDFAAGFQFALDTLGSPKQVKDKKKMEHEYYNLIKKEFYLGDIQVK